MDSKKLNEMEFTRDMIMKLHKLRENDIRGFILNNYGPSVGGDASDALFVEGIAYHPMTKKLWIKFENVDPKGKWFIVADFDGKELEDVGIDMYTPAEAKKEFKKILDMQSNSPENKGSDDMRLWVVWGNL